jgi:hypothetical protein
MSGLQFIRCASARQKVTVRRSLLAARLAEILESSLPGNVLTICLTTSGNEGAIVPR